MAAKLSVIGLAASLLGVLLLFFYGMPFRVAYPDGSPLLSEQSDPRDLRLDEQFKWRGYAGLALIFIGTGFQILGAVYQKR